MKLKGYLKSIAYCLCSLVLASCSNYSPDTYSPKDMQQVNKTDRAIIKSVRQIDVKDPSYGLGASAGGIAGGVGAAQIGQGKGSALTAVGGALVGATIGTLIEQKANETAAFEYIMEKSNGDLITLAQKGEMLAIGTHVLIIYGVQARIIPDTLGTPTNISKH